MGLLEISHRFIITPVCDLFALPPSSSRNRQKIDLCRFDSVLRYLDAPDPTGERFGIKADGRWTDIGDEEMEKAIRDGHVTNSFSLIDKLSWSIFVHQCESMQGLLGNLNNGIFIAIV